MQRLFTKIAAWLVLTLAVCVLGSYLDPLLDDLLMMQHRGGAVRSTHLREDGELAPLLLPELHARAVFAGFSLMSATFDASAIVRQAVPRSWRRGDDVIASPAAPAIPPDSGRAPPALS